jgi:hypothetical protein
MQAAYRRQRVATVSAVLTVGSSFDGEGIACWKKAPAIEIGGLSAAAL